ncbi:hypothetical protein CFN79_19040 [Chromobacterium vaccinii]|uniref:hypothetical protein n=1 Tax=Chromobacterium vaccinii TaxID=1108595 RepID=UPI000CE94690|nr:hypothetical protein [Chromobacterium vaccinii]AVG17794.1 hypothetical protein CFN79_19040 [Chromobacterium vaccinii]
MWEGLWVQESGNVKSDVAYIRQLPTQGMRKAELKRLGRVHGDGYMWDVRRALDSSAVDEQLAPMDFGKSDNPREAALSAARHGARGAYGSN